MQVNAYLWRGTLDTLAFMPLVSADPFGGVIITDWYVPPATPDERFKVNAYILSKQLTADAIKVSVFHQVQQDGQWVDAPADPSTASGLEDRILAQAAEPAEADRRQSTTRLGDRKTKRRPLFEKSGAKTFVPLGLGVAPIRRLAQHKKVFLLLFVHKKKPSSSLQHAQPTVTTTTCSASVSASAWCSAPMAASIGSPASSSSSSVKSS